MEPFHLAVGLGPVGADPVVADTASVARFGPDPGAVAGSVVGDVPDSVHREDPAPFVRWALAALQIPVTCGEQDAVVELPEADRAAFARAAAAAAAAGRRRRGGAGVARLGRALRPVARRAHPAQRRRAARPARAGSRRR